MHMILSPKEGKELVLYCRASELHIFSQSEWG